MDSEYVWMWLGAVDEEHLELLDQWGISPPRTFTQVTVPKSHNVSASSDGKESHADATSSLKPTPPTGILLRNGSIKMTGTDFTPSPYEVRNNHPKSLIPGSSMAASITTPSQTTSQHADPSAARQPQFPGKERNRIHRKPVPTFPEQARTRAESGTRQPIPVIRVEATDPVAVDCRGARVVGGHGPSSSGKSRRHTTHGEGALYRSNALKRRSHTRPGPNLRPKYHVLDTKPADFW